MWHQLPKEIIPEILIRLPAKSIIRFKCVSKTWFLIISNPKFISSYISHNSPTWVLLDRVIEFHTESHKPITRLSVNPSNITTLSVNPDRLLSNYQVIIPDDPTGTNIIFCSSNGLLLTSLVIKPKGDPLEDSFENALSVGNPITHEWVRVPLPFRPAAVGFITRIDSYGDVDKFLVVDYQTALTSDFSKVVAYLTCFSSDTGQWERIMTDYLLGTHLWRCNGGEDFANRMVWYDLRVGIVVWDEDPFLFMESNKKRASCRFVSLPNSPSSNDDRNIYVAGEIMQYMEVFQGCDNVLKVWRLMGFGLPEEGWSLMYNVGRVDFESCGLKMPLPCVCFGHPFDVDVVFLKSGESVCSYNFRSGKVGIRASLSPLKWVIPFVIPSWPTSVPLRLYAAYAKERGNAYFKDQDFVEAIKSYSNSISLFPNSLAFANRAVVHIKVGCFHKAEEDCTEALKLDNNYVKVYGRRALVRKELGNLEGCLEDIEYFLKLEPKNQEMIKQRDEIKSLLEKTAAMEYGHGGLACNVNEG